MVELPLSRVVNRSFVPRYFPLTSPPGYNSLEINPNRGNSRAICLVRVHRTPSLARINFTFEIFRLWSLNSFPKYIFKLHISNVTSRFFLIFKLCIQLFSDIYINLRIVRIISLSLSPQLDKFTYRERIVLDRPIIITFTNPFGMLFRHPDAASPKSISRNKRAGRSLHAIQLVEIISIPTLSINREDFADAVI